MGLPEERRALAGQVGPSSFAKSGPLGPFMESELFASWWERQDKTVPWPRGVT